MAFDDILRAITEEIDKKIDTANKASEEARLHMKEVSRARMQAKKEEIAASVAEKKTAMDRKAEVHTALEHRNAILRKKKELLDRAYAETVDVLATMKPAELEPLLKRCLELISGKGIIHPSKHHAELLKKLAKDERFEIGKEIHAKGGFTFISETMEMDFTIEQLVDRYLRPKTEVALSHSLFA